MNHEKAQKAVMDNPRQRTPGGGRMPSQDELPVSRRATLFVRALKPVAKAGLRAILGVRNPGLWRLRWELARLPRDTPVIFIANHHSMADGPLVGIFMPVQFQSPFMAAGENLTRNQYAFKVIQKLGAVIVVDRAAPPGQAVDDAYILERMRPVPRVDIRADLKTRGLRSLWRDLREVGPRAFVRHYRGQRPMSIALFPEAKLGPEGQINRRFKKGFLRYQEQTGAVIVPIGLNGTVDWRSSRFWRPTTIIDWGKPFRFEPGMSDDAKLLYSMVKVQRRIHPFRERFVSNRLRRILPVKSTEYRRWQSEREQKHGARRIERRMLTMAGGKQANTSPVDPGSRVRQGPAVATTNAQLAWEVPGRRDGGGRDVGR